VDGLSKKHDLARLAEAGKTFIDLWYQQIETLTGAWPPLVFFINNRGQLRVKALSVGDSKAQSRELLKEVPITLAREMACAAGILTSVRMDSGQVTGDEGGQEAILLLLLSADESRVLYRPVFRSDLGDLLFHHWQTLPSEEDLLNGQVVAKIVDALTPVT
jgi:hypothetical protein